MHASDNSKGILLVICASIAWGSMATAIQFLLQRHSVHPGELSAFRLLVSGILMASFGVVTHVKNIFLPFKNRELGIRVLISGVLMCFAHLTFFLAIYYSNAGTGTIFLATQPLLAAIYLCLVKRQFPTKKILCCMVVAFLGVILIVTDGQLDSLKFSPACLLWGSASAVFAVAYSIQPKKAVVVAGAYPVLSWGLIIGGVCGCIINPPVHLIAGFTVPVALAFGYIVVVGTIFAFWCYLSSLKYISPVIVGLVVTLEPLSAFLFSILLLNEYLGFFQAIGIAAIVGTVFAISWDGIPVAKLKKFFVSLGKRR